MVLQGAPVDFGPAIYRSVLAFELDPCDTADICSNVAISNQ